jgi:hypothetical protein
MKFTKNILNEMLDKIIDVYFEEDDLTLGEAIDYVKGLYKDEIDTLE